MQPYHAIDDGRWADKVIGAERARTTYAFRSLLDAGARSRSAATGSSRRRRRSKASTPRSRVARSTRSSLTAGSPSRRSRSWRRSRAYTAGAAYAELAEGEKGSLERGKLADFVLIDRDLTRIPPETIRQARVMMTVVGGQVAFNRLPTGDAP